MIPWHWLVVDKVYSWIGNVGYAIGSIRMVDISIRHVEKRLRQANDRQPRHR